MECLEPVVESKALACFFDFLIFLNLILLCLPSADSDWTNNGVWKSLLGIGGVGVSLAMAAEQMILVLYYGRGLGKRPMLVCDTGVVLLGFVESLSMWQPSSLMAVRTPRLILRLASFRDALPALEDLEEVLQSYWFALRNSAGTLLLLALWTILFAIIALDSFGGCKFDRTAVTGQSNFDSIGNALELMFRMAVGGEYVDVMQAISVQPPYCTPDPWVQGDVREGGLFGTKLVVPATGRLVPRNGDCGRAGGEWFVVVYVAVCRVMIMPMLISAVVSALMEKMDGRRSLVNAEAIQEFERAWKELTAASPEMPQVDLEERPPHLLPRWKLKALCDLLVQGETCPCPGRKRRELRAGKSAADSATQRQPCVFGLLFVKPEDQGGLSVATFYSQLEAVHDLARDEKPAAAAGARS